MDVPPLLRELLLSAVEFGATTACPGGRGHCRAAAARDRRADPALPFYLANPPSTDLAELCRAYLAVPDVGITHTVWADRTAHSERAFTRRFRAETGDSPAVWRTRARLLAALPLRGIATLAIAIRRDRDEGRISNSRDTQAIAGSLVALWDGVQLQWLIDPRLGLAAGTTAAMEDLLAPTSPRPLGSVRRITVRLVGLGAERAR